MDAAGREWEKKARVRLIFSGELAVTVGTSGMHDQHIYIRAASCLLARKFASLHIYATQAAHAYRNKTFPLAFSAACWKNKMLTDRTFPRLLRKRFHPARKQQGRGGATGKRNDEDDGVLAIPYLPLSRTRGIFF